MNGQIMDLSCVMIESLVQIKHIIGLILFIIQLNLSELHLAI
jgi:hypothetical protein